MADRLCGHLDFDYVLDFHNGSLELFCNGSENLNILEIQKNYKNSLRACLKSHSRVQSSAK